METQSELHQNYSAHEKQFAYLPLAILDAATNIRQLFSHIDGGAQLNAMIEATHTQMSTTHWPPEMSNLRFIDTASDDGNNKGTVDRNAAAGTTNAGLIPKRRMTRSLSMRPTSIELKPKHTPVVAKRVLRQSRKRKVDKLYQHEPNWH